MSLNRVILIGRLACDVEKKTTQTGVTYSRFRLAVDRRRGKNADAANTADFIPIVAWDRLAEICADYLTKGKLVAIEGRLQVRTYEVDGQKRTGFDVVADDMRMLSSKDGASRSGGSSNYGAPAAPQDPFGSPSGGYEFEDENVPF